MSTTRDSKRVSTVPKPPTDISNAVIIADTASLIGKKLITIRDNVIIHPKATLSSAHGHITIGSTCIVGERSNIGLQVETLNQAEGVIIEDCVVIDSNAVIESRRIGRGSRIEVGAVLGRGSVVGKVSFGYVLMLYYVFNSDDDDLAEL